MLTKSAPIGSHLGTCLKRDRDNLELSHKRDREVRRPKELACEEQLRELARGLGHIDRYTDQWVSVT